MADWHYFYFKGLVDVIVNSIIGLAIDSAVLIAAEIDVGLSKKFL